MGVSRCNFSNTDFQSDLEISKIFNTLSKRDSENMSKVATLDSKLLQIVPQNYLHFLKLQVQLLILIGNQIPPMLIVFRI